MNHIAYLSTGSNVGESARHLATALKLINSSAGKVLHASALYKTEPWGNKEQEPFLNQAIQIETALSAHELMQSLLSIESLMGRVREKKWEPRIIDIDILFYDNEVIQDELKIPHPLLQERRFVLEPLVEIAPGLMHPVLHKTITQLLAECADNSVVEKL